MSLLISCISEDKGVISWSGTVKDEKLIEIIQLCKRLSVKMVSLHGANVRFVGYRAVFGSEIEGGRLDLSI